MPTTFSHTLPTLADYDLKLKQISATPWADVKCIDSVTGADKDTATYRYTTGAGADLFDMVFTRRYEPSTDTTHNNMRLLTKERKTVSETGEVTDVPIESGIHWNHRGRYPASSTVMLEVVSALLSVFAVQLVGANGLPTAHVINVFANGSLSALK
jgi:hypothetical protein